MSSELAMYLKAIISIKTDLEKLIDLLEKDAMWRNRERANAGSRNTILNFERELILAKENLSLMERAEAMLPIALDDPAYFDEEFLDATKDMVDCTQKVKLDIIQWLEWSHDIQGLEPFSENSGSSSN